MKIVDGWLDEAEVCASPNFDERPGSIDIDLLVIHNISLPPGQFENGYVKAFFKNKLPIEAHPFFDEIKDLKVSSHFLITRSGRIIQFVSCLQRAWHAGVSSFCGRERCNDFSLGIELEGTDDIPYENVQYEMLASLTEAIQQAYPAIESNNIVGHSDIAPGRKTDPGPSFDWERYKSLLTQYFSQY